MIRRAAVVAVVVRFDGALEGDLAAVGEAQQIVSRQGRDGGAGPVGERWARSDRVAEGGRIVVA